MLVACRLADLSALETHYAGSAGARNAGHSAHWPHSGPITPGSSLAFPIPVRGQRRLPRPVASEGPRALRWCVAGNRGCGAGQCLASKTK
jgi:hypothetical protein